MKTINDDLTVLGMLNAPNIDSTIKHITEPLMAAMNELAAQVAAINTQLEELRAEQTRVADKLDKNIIL